MSLRRMIFPNNNSLRDIVKILKNVSNMPNHVLLEIKTSRKAGDSVEDIWKTKIHLYK